MPPPPLKKSIFPTAQLEHFKNETLFDFGYISDYSECFWKAVKLFF